MAFQFKVRTGEVKREGTDKDFATVVSEHAREQGGEATFTFTQDNKADKVDKLVFWGKGREIADVLSKNAFTVATKYEAGLRFEITWKPRTKEGAKQIVADAAKGAVKEAGKLAGKAALHAATHGASAAVDLAQGVHQVAKSAVEAAKSGISVDVDNLEVEWEARIEINSGSQPIADEIVDLTKRSFPFGKKAPSKQLGETFLEAMGKYVASLGNAVQVVTGGPRYDRLLDQEDVVRATTAAKEKEGKKPLAALEKLANWFKERRRRPGTTGYDELED